MRWMEVFCSISSAVLTKDSQKSHATTNRYYPRKNTASSNDWWAVIEWDRRDQGRARTTMESWIESGSLKRWKFNLSFKKLLEGMKERYGISKIDCMPLFWRTRYVFRLLQSSSGQRQKLPRREKRIFFAPINSRAKTSKNSTDA